MEVNYIFKARKKVAVTLKMKLILTLIWKVLNMFDVFFETIKVKLTFFYKQNVFH